MKWFLELTMRIRLLVGFGLMIVLLAVVIGVAYAVITGMRSSLETLSRIDFTNVRDLKDIRSNHNAIRAAIQEMLSHPRGAAFEESYQETKERAKENSARIPKLLERNKHNSSIIAQLNELIAVQKEFADTRETRVIPLIAEGKVEDARQLALGILRQQDRKMRGIADGLVSKEEARTEEAARRAEEEAAWALRFFLGLGIVAFLVGGGFSGGVIRAFRESSRELRDGVNVLGTSAAEILAATTQVASGAAETATAVTETTTTVEELKQTVQVASQKARYVSESAQRSVQVSQTGRKAVEETVEGMGRIREQMESIAGSIVRLSEQSQAIGEIIATVNDLAEQSNLLAVNAAIEAAKAGEHGRGFGVVAQEVKSLAEQSKQATAQVRAILNDIQRATSAAVMATEQGTKAVAAGAKQSTEAGESIRLLGESIAEAAQAATQIAASSQQQSAGIEQVALAMENIKQASAQNVASTKQSEAAAQDLNQLGQRLKQMAEKL